MKLQPELLDENSPQGLEVYDIAPDVDKAVLTYPDKPTFLEDGRRLMFTIDKQPVLCHLDDKCKLEPLTPKLPGMFNADWDLTSGGRYMVYKATPPAEDELLVRRLDFRTGQVDDIFNAKGNFPGTNAPVSKFNIQTASSDGLHFGGRVYLGDGKTHQAGYAIIICDTTTNTSKIIYKHNDLFNTHMQYSRQTEAPGMYDLLIQMNHGSITNAEGKVELGLGPPTDLGVDVHVMQDDGSNRRELPFGRDGLEGNIGHQIWRGQTDMAVTVTLENLDKSYGWAEGTRQHVIAGTPAPEDPANLHKGRIDREKYRVELSKGFKDPRFCHLGVDDTGLRFSFDTFPVFTGTRAGMLIYIGQAKDMHSPLAFQYILNTGIVFTGGDKGTHAHPILSPGGKELFFNSNMLGKPKAYMVKNLPWPE